MPPKSRKKKTTPLAKFTKKPSYSGKKPKKPVTRKPGYSGKPKGSKPPKPKAASSLSRFGATDRRKEREKTSPALKEKVYPTRKARFDEEPPPIVTRRPRFDEEKAPLPGTMPFARRGRTKKTPEQQVYQDAADDQLQRWLKFRADGVRKAPGVGRAYFDPSANAVTPAPIGYPLFYNPNKRKATLSDTGIPMVLPTQLDIDLASIWPEYEQMAGAGRNPLFLDLKHRKLTESQTSYPLFWDEKNARPTFRDTGKLFLGQTYIEYDSEELAMDFARTYGRGMSVQTDGKNPMYLHIGPDGSMSLTNQKSEYPLYLDPATGTPTFYKTGYKYTPKGTEALQELMSPTLLQTFFKTYGIAPAARDQQKDGIRQFFDLQSGSFTSNQTPYPLYVGSNGEPVFSNTGVPYRFGQQSPEEIKANFKKLMDNFHAVYGADPSTVSTIVKMSSTAPMTREQEYRYSHFAFGQYQLKQDTLDAASQRLAKYGGYPEGYPSIDNIFGKAFDDGSVWIPGPFNDITPITATKMTKFASWIDQARMMSGTVSFSGGYYKNYIETKDVVRMVGSWALNALPDLASKFYHDAMTYLEEKSRPDWAPARAELLVNLNRARSQEEIDSLLTDPESPLRAAPIYFHGDPVKVQKMFDNPVYRAASIRIVAVDMDTMRVVPINQVARLKGEGINIQWIDKKELKIMELEKDRQAATIAEIVLFSMLSKEPIPETFEETVKRTSFLTGLDPDNWAFSKDVNIRDEIEKIPGGHVSIKYLDALDRIDDYQRDVGHAPWRGGEYKKEWLRLLDDLGLTEEEGNAFLTGAQGFKAGAMSPRPLAARSLALKAIDKYATENLWTEAEAQYVAGQQLIDRGEVSRGLAVLRGAIEIDMKGARGRYSPFGAHTIDVYDGRKERYVDALVQATAQLRRPLTDMEIWTIRGMHEDPWREALTDAGVEVLTVAPDLIADVLLRGIGLGIKTAVKLPIKGIKYLANQSDTLAKLGTKLGSAPVIKQVFGTVAWIRQDSARTVRLNVQEQAQRGFYELSRHVIDEDELPDVVSRVARSAWEADTVGDAVRIMTETAGADRVLRTAPSTYHILATMFHNIKRLYLDYETQIARGILAGPNPLAGWHPQAVGRHVTDILNDIRQVAGEKAMDDGLALGLAQDVLGRQAQNAATKAVGNRAMVAKYVAAQVYQDLSKAMYRVPGTSMAYDSVLYKMLTEFGLEHSQGLMSGVKAWLNLTQWVKSMWIFQVLAGRPAWLARNVFDSGLRYMLAGGSLFDDLGAVTDLTTRKLFGKTLSQSSAAEAFSFALPGGNPTLVRRIQAGEFTRAGWPGLLGTIIKEGWTDNWRLARESFALAKEKGAMRGLKELVATGARGNPFVMSYLTFGHTIHELNSVVEFSLRIRLIHREASRIFRASEKAMEEVMLRRGAELGLDSKMSRRLVEIYRGAYDDPDKLLELSENIASGKLDNIIVTADLQLGEVESLIAHLQPYEQEILIEPLREHFANSIITAIQRGTPVDGNFINKLKKEIVDALDNSILEQANNPPMDGIAGARMAEQNEVLDSMYNTETVIDDLDGFAHPDDVIPHIPETPLIREVKYRAKAPENSFARLTRLEYKRSSDYISDWVAVTGSMGTRTQITDLGDDLFRVVRNDDGLVTLQINGERLANMRVPQARKVLRESLGEWLHVADADEITKSELWKAGKTFQQDFQDFLRNPARFQRLNPDKFKHIVGQFERVDGLVESTLTATGELKFLKYQGITRGSDALTFSLGLTGEEATEAVTRASAVGTYIPRGTIEASSRFRGARESLGRMQSEMLRAGDLESSKFLHSVQRLLTRLLGDAYGGRLGKFFREVVPGPMAKTGTVRADMWEEFFALGRKVSESFTGVLDENLRKLNAWSTAREVGERVAEPKVNTTIRNILSRSSIHVEFKPDGSLQKLVINREGGGAFVVTDALTLDDFYRVLFGDLPGAEDATKAKEFFDSPWYKLQNLIENVTDEVPPNVNVGRDWSEDIIESIVQKWDLPYEEAKSAFMVADALSDAAAQALGLSKKDFWERLTITTGAIDVPKETLEQLANAAGNGELGHMYQTFTTAQFLQGNFSWPVLSKIGRMLDFPEHLLVKNSKNWLFNSILRGMVDPTKKFTQAEFFDLFSKQPARFDPLNPNNQGLTNIIVWINDLVGGSTQNEFYGNWEQAVQAVLSARGAQRTGVGADDIIESLDRLWGTPIETRAGLFEPDDDWLDPLDEILKKAGVRTRGKFLSGMPSPGAYNVHNLDEMQRALERAVANRNYDEFYEVFNKLAGLPAAAEKRQKVVNGMIARFLGIDELDPSEMIGDFRLGELIVNGRLAWVNPEHVDNILEWSERILGDLDGRELTVLDKQMIESSRDGVRRILDGIDAHGVLTVNEKVVAKAIYNALDAKIYAKQLDIWEGKTLWDIMPLGTRNPANAAYRGMSETIVKIAGGPSQGVVFLHEFAHALQDLWGKASVEGNAMADAVTRDLYKVGEWFQKHELDIAMMLDSTPSFKRVGKEWEWDTYFTEFVEQLSVFTPVAVKEDWLGMYKTRLAVLNMRPFIKRVLAEESLPRILFVKGGGYAQLRDGTPVVEAMLNAFTFMEDKVEDVARARMYLSSRAFGVAGEEVLIHPRRMDLKMWVQVADEAPPPDAILDLGQHWVPLNPRNASELAEIMAQAEIDAVRRPKLYKQFMGGLDELSITNPELAAGARIYMAAVENLVSKAIQDGRKIMEDLANWSDFWSIRNMNKADMEEHIAFQTTKWLLEDNAMVWKLVTRHIPLAKIPKYVWVAEKRPATALALLESLLGEIRNFRYGHPMKVGGDAGMWSASLRTVLVDLMENGIFNPYSKSKFGTSLPPLPHILEQLGHPEGVITNARNRWSVKGLNLDKLIAENEQFALNRMAWKADDEFWKAFISQPIYGDKSLLKLFGQDALIRENLLPKLDTYITELKSRGLEVDPGYLNSIKWLREWIANWHNYLDNMGRGMGLPKTLPPLALPVPLPPWKQPLGWTTWLGGNIELAAKRQLVVSVLEAFADNMKKAVKAGDFGRFTINEDLSDPVSKLLREMYDTKVDNINYAFQGGDNIPGIGRHVGALKQTGDTMLDYSQSSVGDEFMKSFYPFWMFPSRSVPFWLKQLQYHPEIFTWYLRYYATTEKDLRGRGLVTTSGEPMPSLAGKIRVPGTQIWFDPTQVFSWRFMLPRPWLLDQVTGRYETEDSFTLSKAFQRIMLLGEWFGFHTLPHMQYPVEALTGEEVGLTDINLMPVTELIPPWIDRSLRSKLRRTFLRGLADAPFWAPEYDFIDLMIEQRLLSEAMVRIQATDSMQDKVRMAAEIKEALGYKPNYDYDGKYLGYSVDIDRTNPLWQDAEARLRSGNYLLGLAGYFTGFYAKMFTDADVQFYQMRHELNLLRDSINNEILSESYMPKDMGPEDLYEAYIGQRYDTPEGELYDVRGLLSFVRAPNGTLIEDPSERRFRIIELLDQKEREQAYWDSVEQVSMELQEALARIPIGDAEQRSMAYQAFFDSRALIDENDMFREARRSWTFGYKPGSMVVEHFTGLAFQLYKEAKPVRQDGENYAVYRMRVAVWEQEFERLIPLILSATRKSVMQTASGYDISPAGDISLPGNRTMNIMDLTQQVQANLTRENFDKWTKARDTVLDAVEQVYQDNYIDSYWETVETAENKFDRELLAQKFLQKGTPSEEQIVEWVQENYPGRWTDKEIMNAILGRGMTSMTEKLAPDTEKEKKVEEIWDWLLWAGPSSSQLRKAYEEAGGRDSDFDVWYATNGNPDAWGNSLAFDRFYMNLSNVIEDMELKKPTHAMLAEWSQVREYNDKFYLMARAQLGEDIDAKVSAYYNLSTYTEKGQKLSPRQQFMKEHPEVLNYLALRDAFAVNYPDWAKYFNTRAYEEIMAGETPYWLKKAKGGASSGKGGGGGGSGYRSGGYWRSYSGRGWRSYGGGGGGWGGYGGSEDTPYGYVPMGYRSTFDPSQLRPAILGKGGYGGRIRVSQNLAQAVGAPATVELVQLENAGVPPAEGMTELLLRVSELQPELKEEITKYLSLIVQAEQTGEVKK